VQKGYALNKNKIKILMLSAGVVSGAFRMMMDILQYIDRNKFEIIVAYKPNYAEWTNYEIDSIIHSNTKLTPLRGESLFDPAGFIDLWNILRKEQIDIIHCWDILRIPARLIAKLSKVKIVEELGNPPPKILSQISLKHYFINKITSILVDGYVACSHGIMNAFHEMKPVHLKKKHLAVIHNCVDVPNLELSADKIAHIRRQYSLGNHELILTNIGYFNKQKAQTDLLLAFKQVAVKRSDVRLIIVGWGTLEKELMQLTTQLNLQDKVIYTGKLTRPKIFEILSITDLFVLSSHWEGFGIVLAEAMALGKPVISSNTHGTREVVENGKSGILVPVNDPRSLAETVLNLLARPDLMLQMGQEGLKRVIELFNCEQFIEGYENFYEAVFSMN
jgi:glycosyltransferase involved in cell wall biosynthesis